MSHVGALASTSDFHEVMLKLFAADWMKSPLVEMVSRTMQDWLKDVNRWMNDYLFPRYVHRCAQLVLHQYILRLAVRAPAFLTPSRVRAARDTRH